MSQPGTRFEVVTCPGRPECQDPVCSSENLKDPISQEDMKTVPVHHVVRILHIFDQWNREDLGQPEDQRRKIIKQVLHCYDITQLVPYLHHNNKEPLTSIAFDSEALRALSALYFQQTGETVTLSVAAESKMTDEELVAAMNNFAAVNYSYEVTLAEATLQNGLSRLTDNNLLTGEARRLLMQQASVLPVEDNNFFQRMYRVVVYVRTGDVLPVPAALTTLTRHLRQWLVGPWDDTLPEGLSPETWAKEQLATTLEAILVQLLPDGFGSVQLSLPGWKALRELLDPFVEWLVLHSMHQCFYQPTMRPDENVGAKDLRYLILDLQSLPDPAKHNSEHILLLHQQIFRELHKFFRCNIAKNQAGALVFPLYTRDYDTWQWQNDHLRTVEHLRYTFTNHDTTEARVNAAAHSMIQKIRFLLKLFYVNDLSQEPSILYDTWYYCTFGEFKSDLVPVVYSDERDTFRHCVNDIDSRLSRRTSVRNVPKLKELFQNISKLAWTMPVEPPTESAQLYHQYMYQWYYKLIDKSRAMLGHKTTPEQRQLYEDIEELWSNLRVQLPMDRLLLQHQYGPKKRRN